MESVLLKVVVVFLSAIFASFLKCFVDSEDKREFFFGRSKCASCGSVLSAWDLVPIFSYLGLRGRCRYCEAKIPIDIFLYEFFTVVIFSLYFLFQDYFIFLSIYNVINLVLLVFLAIEDCRSLEVVDEIFYIFLLYNIVDFCFEFSMEHLGEVAFLILLYHIFYYFVRRGLGYGDIKVFCTLALSLNILENLYLFAYTFLWAGSFCIILIILKRVGRKSEIPLVPFIAFGYFTIMIIREGLLW